MFAIVKSGAIESTGTLNQLFPNTSFPGGVAPNDFKIAEGVQNIVQGEQKDIMYFDVTAGDISLVGGKPTQTYTNTAKDLTTLKSERTARVKEQANEQLALTDWMVIRLAERETAIPSATATYRAAVITECARLETAIAGAANVDALAVVMNAQNWPGEL
jgi:hypothetical protein